jgi:Zn-dependent protease
MWTCASCGAEVDDNFAACWSCGVQVDGTPGPRLMREDASTRCYVCDAPGEFAEVDGVEVCPECVAGTTADPPARKRSLSSRIRVGRIGRFPLFVEPASILLAIVFILFAPHWAIFAILVVSVLAHELGHAVVGQVVGKVGGSITLSPWGGVYLPTSSGSGMSARQRRRWEMLITAAGPAANLLLALLCLMFSSWFDSILLRVAASVNLYLALANLLPLPPLDGGQLVVAAVARTPELRARLYFWYAVIIGVGWSGMMIFLYSGGGSAVAWNENVWNLVTPYLQLLPYLGIYCFVIAVEKPVPDRWRLARMDRELKRERAKN